MTTIARRTLYPCRELLWFVLIGTFFLVMSTVQAQSLRFYGNGTNDIDRVKIRIDDPASHSDPGPPADVGATDFTIELWLRPTSENTAPAISCGSNYNWIMGNIVFDRDRYGQGRNFGLSLGAGQVTFGIVSASGAATTICAGPDLRDGSWHHVAVQRRRSDGYLWLYVDGQLRASAPGPSGDVSYPDDGIPGRYCNGQPCTYSDPFIVLGAEKHDVSRTTYPSYRGWMDEVRISTVLRYSGNFAVPTQPFNGDSSTAALYHFDEGTGDTVIDAMGNRSPGVRRYGGSPAGPAWTTDTPFGSSSAAAGEINFTTTTYAGSEGGGSITVVATRTGGASGTASVNYSVTNGSATAGADFSAVSGTLSWAAGASGERTFTVPLIDDTAIESTETATLVLSSAVGATLGSRRTATLSISDNDSAAAQAAGPLDAFSRSNGDTIGNGWIEKNAGAFSLYDGRVRKNGTATDYRSNLLYRPASESSTNVEVSAELRITNSAVGYPLIVARLQNPTLTNGFSGYILSMGGSATNAVISRQNGSGWDTVLARITLTAALNTTDTYRLRLRVSGTSTVALTGYVERRNGSSWQIIGWGGASDSSSSRISTAGTIALSGDQESAYSFDNVMRSAL